MLVEDPSIAEYYLASGSQWQRWSSTRNIVLRSGAPTGGPSTKAGVVGAGNAGTFAMYIPEGYFSLIALNFADTTSLDQSIVADLRRNRHYHIDPGRALRRRPGWSGAWQVRDLAIRAAEVIGQPTVSTGTMARPTAAGEPAAAWPGASASSGRRREVPLYPAEPALPDDRDPHRLVLPHLSQIRLETEDLVLAPFLLFTVDYVVYQAISLPVNFAAPGFDLAAHQARVGGLAPARLSGGGHLPAHLRRADRVAAQHLDRGRPRSSRQYQGRARAYVLDDGP